MRRGLNNIGLGLAVLLALLSLGPSLPDRFPVPTVIVILGWLMLAVVATPARYRGLGVYVTACLLACAVILFFGAPPDRAAIEAQGLGIVAALQVHEAQSGAYPATAEEAGLHLPMTRFGRWSYRRLDEGFELSVGSYRRDGFTFALDERGSGYFDS